MERINSQMISENGQIMMAMEKAIIQTQMTTMMDGLTKTNYEQVPTHFQVRMSLLNRLKS